MENFFIFFALFVFGTLFGSFSSVLISRWKHNEKGILMGRSACPHCKHTLSASELIPIFSFLFQKWKCKNCHTKIPYSYPVLELCMGLIFVLMGYAWLHIFQLPIFSVAFFFLIFLWFITVVYIFYDIFYLEIPDEIFVLFIVWNIILFILTFFINPESIYFNWKNFHTFHTYYSDGFFWVILLYTFLYLQIFISGSIFLLKNKKYKDILELFLLYFLFPFVAIWDFFKKFFSKNSLQEQDEIEEIPFWVGPWDLFLAIIIGWTLGITHGIFAFFFAYLIGSVVWVLILLFSKKNSENSALQVPFWPFLGIGFFLAIIFYEQIKIFVNSYFLF